MTLLAKSEQVGRQFIEHANVCQMMHLGCRPFAALFASVVGALQDMLTPFTPEGWPFYGQSEQQPSSQVASDRSDRPSSKPTN